MRHAVSGRKLGRDTNARKALASNLASALIVEGHIITTLAKAKFVRSFAEKLITDAKRSNLYKQRSTASRLTHNAFIRLITQIAPGFDARNGGYTRIIKLASRRGDAAPMAKIEILPWDKSKTIQLTKNAKPPIRHSGAKRSGAIESKPVKNKKTLTKTRNEKPKAK